MVVFTQRTFKLTVRRKIVFWVFGITFIIGITAISGSGYGLWATKKLMSFNALEEETKQQQEQLRESLEQANGLQQELDNLYALVQDLMKKIDPRAAADLKVGSEIKSDDDSDSSTSNKANALKSELDAANDRLKALQTHMAPIILRSYHTPAVEPTVGHISSGFGTRINPFYRANTGGDGVMSYHTGIDISNAPGTPIQATANGVITTVKFLENYGLTVIISHTKELETLYAHLRTAYVREGDKVGRGHIIGLMGNSGRTTGPHLHYEVRKNGTPVDPKPYLRLQRQWLAGLK
jgi:murein DD-endopeptidase MepM/ murein hydrolase activator NlpD